MKREMIVRLFRRSLSIGMVFEVVEFGFVLLCGYFIAELLEAVMNSQWHIMQEAGIYSLLALFAAILPKYGFAIRRSHSNLVDTQRCREFLYQEILNRNISVKNGGEMNVRMNSDVETIAAYFQQTIPKAVSGGIVMLCSTILICVIDYRIGLIFSGLNLTQLIPILVYEKWTRQIYNQTHSDEETYCNWILEGYGGIRTIKLYGIEAWFMNRFYELNRAIINSGKQAEQAGTVESIIFAMIDSLLNYGSYVIIGLFVWYGGLNMSDTPLLIILAQYLFASVRSVFEWRMQQFRYQEAYKRLETEEKKEEREGNLDALEVKHITKAYGERRVLCDASCTIRVGEHVLLKGDNGSGKSTLLRILLGLEKADSGSVVYGIPKSACAVSFQEEPELNISGKELFHALKKTGSVDIDALIRHFKEFQIWELLSKPLSELSPGERKKFYLSAALAWHGGMLVLDEPTNHIDQRSIRYLRDQLCAYKGTLIVCTHETKLDMDWNKKILVEGGVCHEW